MNQKGLIEVKLGDFSKIAHFSMNFIKILKDEFDYGLEDVGNALVNGDEFDRFSAFSELLYAGFKAFDLQNMNTIDYTVETCLEWTLLLSDEQIEEFQEALMYAVALNTHIKQLGKKKREESPQKKI